MNKIMGYILIIVGILAIMSGIMMLTNSNQSDNKDTKTINKEYTSYPIKNKDITINIIPSDTQNLSRNATVEENVNKEEITSVARAPTNTSANQVESKQTAEEKIQSSKDKGDSFENFVCNLLADWRLKLLDRTQDKVSTAGVVAESSKNPDLHIQQKRGNADIDYYIECKYRSRWNDGIISFEEWQINRYRQFQRENRRKVILAIGVGGSPSAPATLMLVPLDSLKNNGVRKIDTQYVISANSDALVEYMNNYFNTVFKKARSNKNKKTWSK